MGLFLLPYSKTEIESLDCSTQTEQILKSLKPSGEAIGYIGFMDSKILNQSV